jgi:hypothetical protein
LAIIGTVLKQRCFRLGDRISLRALPYPPNC